MDLFILVLFVGIYGYIKMKKEVSAENFSLLDDTQVQLSIGDNLSLKRDYDAFMKIVKELNL